MTQNRPMSRRTASGVSLIEVLVTLVVLLLGLLGLAATMIHSQRSETESYQRVQAMILLQDMVSRINANRAVASCYAFTDATAGAPFLGSNGDADDVPACASGSATQNARATADLTEWHALLQGAAETSAGESVGAMIGARGCVWQEPMSGIYQVSVAWQGLGRTTAPSDTWTCGAGTYGDDSYRRVVSVTMRIAAL